MGSCGGSDCVRFRRSMDYFDGIRREGLKMRKEDEAIFNFYSKFAEYVKGMDPDMWERAKEYATDWHGTDGVGFVKVEDEQWDE